MSKHLHIDAIGGAAGDMLLAALFDIGLNQSEWRKEISKLAIEQTKIDISQVMRGTFAAQHVNISPMDGKKVEMHNHSHRHEHENEHEHEHQHDHSHEKEETQVDATPLPGPKPVRWFGAQHRAYTDVVKLIDASHLADPVKRNANAIFERLAECEAKVHGTSVDKVTFHEVGAIDSILDIVGFCLGIHMLRINTLTASTLPVSSGFVHCAHGQVPLPAPATLHLLNGWPTRQGQHGHEQVTPTGAAIITTLCKAADFPAMIPIASGYGAGSRDPKAYPNIVRVALGEIENALSGTATEIIEMRCNIDDMPGEDLPLLIEQLLDAGALDAFGQQILMKKGRPGFLITVLGKTRNQNALKKILFVHSSTFGIRYIQMSRDVLERHYETLETPYGSIRIKVGHLQETEYQRQPEHSDLVQAAKNHNTSLKEMRRIVYRLLAQEPDQ